MISDKIRPHHLDRKAILYVRQSSAHQVLHNRESSALQYAMRDRLTTLGWSEIEVIDDDLGRSAAGGVQRAGFERMVAQVCLGKVGAVAAREVSRFARNSRDWQQLIEMCRVVDTVLVDQETVYAPRHGNDRLLLGLKGSLNEYELDLLRQRSLAARYEKARRGELVVGAPVGFVKAGDRYEKDPDRRVQEAISLVFDKVLELGAAGEVKLLLKDFGASRLPKDDLSSRRNRELRVYRDLLAGGGLGTAEYHGAVWDEARGRFWLLLELVDGVELRSLGFEDWVRSAVWLGRLHGRFARAGEALEASDFLVRHDAGFFHAQAEQASRAAATYPLELREPVLAVTRRYSRAVEVLVGGPRTLVHGSYRPQNILVDRAARPPRVLAVDWELSALGSPLYDFAFLSDGFRGGELDDLWGAYREEAVARGLPLPERGQMEPLLDCFRLHKVLKSIGDSVAQKFEERVVRKLVTRAAEIGTALPF